MTTAPATGVPCPACDHPHSRVVGTERHRGGVVRRRRCKRCDHQFRTTERLSHAFPPRRARR